MKTYTSERIINISELEEIIMKSYAIAQLIKKANPQDESVKSLVNLLKQADEFEFVIERRKTVFCKKHPFKWLFRFQN